MGFNVVGYKTEKYKYLNTNTEQTKSVNDGIDTSIAPNSHYITEDLIPAIKESWDVASAWGDSMKNTISSWVGNNVNPSETSGRASVPPDMCAYPISTPLDDFCFLTFYAYDRFATEKTKTETPTLYVKLPLPLGAPDNIQTNNNTADLGLYGNITTDNVNKAIRGGSGDVDDIESDLNSGIAALTENIRKDSAKNAMKIGAVMAASKLSDGAKNAANLHAGFVLNPHTAAMFDGVALRSFTLDWRLSPRTQRESNEIQKILTLIKLRSLPGEILGGLSLNYPDTVQVEFEGKVKQYLPMYKRSFLTSISITPDSNGGIVFYESGAPVTYNIQLGFMELSINTRNTVIEQMKDYMENVLRNSNG